MSESESDEGPGWHGEGGCVVLSKLSALLPPQRRVDANGTPNDTDKTEDVLSVFQQLEDSRELPYLDVAKRKPKAETGAAAAAVARPAKYQHLGRWLELRETDRKALVKAYRFCKQDPNALDEDYVRLLFPRGRLADVRRLMQSPGFIQYARKCEQLGIERALRQQHVHAIAEQEQELATESEEEGGGTDMAWEDSNGQTGAAKRETDERIDTKEARQADKTLTAGWTATAAHKPHMPLKQPHSHEPQVAWKGRHGAAASEVSNAQRLQAARNALDTALALQSTIEVTPVEPNPTAPTGPLMQVAARRSALDAALDAQLFGEASC